LSRSTLVGVPNWRDTGKIGYALGPDVTVVCLNQDAREFGLVDPAARFIGRDMLVLALEHPGRTEHDLTASFASLTPLPPAPIRHAGRVLAEVTVLQAHDLRHWP